MKIVDAIKQKESALAEAVSVLRAGGIVVYPTETTYGIAVDVENSAAVQKLLDYKGKRDGKPISVAVADQSMAEQYVTLNPTAIGVYERFLPGPVTVISTGIGTVARGIASPEGKVGIRIPKHELALELISAFGHGITATGANASNKKRPYTIQDILDNTSESQQSLIDLVIDIGELPHNDPSTVIDTTIDDIVILRQGPTYFSHSESITTHSEAETIEWFSAFVSRFRSAYTYTPVLFLFTGEMGAGKTHAIQGVAKGLGISDTVTSPTYALANEYEYTNESRPGVFVHMDCWKVANWDELIDVGLDNYIQSDAVIAIEWAERFTKQFEAYGERAKLIWISLEPGVGETERVITYSL